MGIYKPRDIELLKKKLVRKLTRFLSEVQPPLVYKPLDIELLKKKLVRKRTRFISDVQPPSVYKCHILNGPINNYRLLNIGIKHGFPCINVCQVLREMLKTEAEGRGFQQLPRNLANVNALKKKFDRCYCINSTTMLKKNAGHYFRPHRNYLADAYTHYPFL